MDGSLNDLPNSSVAPPTDDGDPTATDFTVATTATATTSIRMLEFFSGIGGMRISLEKALRLLNDHSDSCGEESDKGREPTTTSSSQATAPTPQKRTYVLESCRAYDISLHANNVYRHNFCAGGSSGDNHHSVCTKLVEQLRPRDVASLRANLWTMSPPCQPFTTNGEGRGKQRLDASDKRCNGLKGIMRLLEGLEQPEKPKWILLENVRGFAESAMCELWRECLLSNGYSYRSFVLSPIEFGIPNHRTRYYLLAELDSQRWSSEEILGSNCSSVRGEEEKETAKATTPLIHGIASLSTHDAIAKRPIHKVGRYLEQPNEPEEDDSTPYLVPSKVLAKAWSRGLGIVSEHDTATHCFTAGYGRIYHRSTGSLLLVPGSEMDVRRKKQSLEALPLDRSDMTLYEDQLRRFTPDELLRLFGFVDCVEGNEKNESCSAKQQTNGGRVFEIPSTVVPSLEQRYKLIGNSIGVNVVTELMHELLLSA
jgi:tRNA (cytosine38-C5)-methyltransferase